MAGKLAVIGGGPKAAAIAAKAFVLKHLGLDPPEVEIFESDHLGAAWSGRSGYTDGTQPLCTLAERDLGYPYDRATFGVRAAGLMQGLFSWHAFCVREGTDRIEYNEWVTRGRNPPIHSDFARYVESSIRLSGAQQIRGEVVELDYTISGNLWLITWRDSAGQLHRSTYDGVVITGSGPPKPPLPQANSRVFDGKSFWQSIPAVIQLLQASLDRSVVIIGAGGTGAAVAYWCVRKFAHMPIYIVGREATLHTRHSGYFEDRLFTDPVAWGALPDHIKDAFVSRLTSGVVWDYVMRALSGANLEYHCREARGFHTLPSYSATNPPELAAEFVEVAPPGSTPPSAASPITLTLNAPVFVDARGFERWWFADQLMASSLRRFFAPTKRSRISASVDASLSVGGAVYPRLHVPGLASRQGPGAANLMALGWVADQVLRAYVSPPPPRFTVPSSASISP